MSVMSIFIVAPNPQRSINQYKGNQLGDFTCLSPEIS